MLTTKIEKILDPDDRITFEREASYNAAKRLRDAILLLTEEIEKLKQLDELKKGKTITDKSHEMGFDDGLDD